MKKRRAMIEPGASLSIWRQCELLAVSRSGSYYEPVGTSEEELILMRRVDALHLEFPFFGSRKMREQLDAEGHRINRKRVQRLMRQMGLESMACKPKATARPPPSIPATPTCFEA